MIDHKIGLDEFNLRYSYLNPEQRIRKLYKDFNPEKVLFTSSFGTSSVYLLDLIHKINPNQDIYFIDTRFHFQETLAYKRRLIQIYDLNVIDLVPEERDNVFAQEHKTWLTDPDLCCFLNKVKPVDLIKDRYDIWISGLSNHQTVSRRDMSIFEDKQDIIKFHPILDVSAEEIEKQIIHQNLPVHPLKFMGYGSVGCTHCTALGSARLGRWAGFDKSECGLHVG